MARLFPLTVRDRPWTWAGAQCRRSVLERLVRYGQLKARIKLVLRAARDGPGAAPGDAAFRGTVGNVHAAWFCGPSRRESCGCGRWRVPSRTVAGHSQAGLPRREACPFSDACLDREHVHGLRAIAGVENCSFGLGFRRTGVVNDEIDPPAPARVAQTFDAPLR